MPTEHMHFIMPYSVSKQKKNQKTKNEKANKTNKKTTTKHSFFI
jgi:hypothetical protein